MKHQTEICANCGADKGLHHSDTEQCPKNGIEENRWNQLTGKYYPQQWSSTAFEDSGIKKLNDAAPEMLKALIEIREWYEENREKYLGEYTPVCFSKGLSVIKKVTE